MDVDNLDDVFTVKEEDLLPLIIQQLSAFGYTQLASMVGEQTDTPVDLPSNRLSELAALGLIKEQEPEDGEEDLKPTFESDEGVEDGEKAKNCLSIDGETISDPKEVPEYRTLYTTAHKGACTTAIFSPDGRYIATGSADTSLKVIDVSKCKRLNERTGEPLEKPVIRTLYDHAGPVNEVAFHPNGLVLASCSEDQTIKLFDISKPGIKRSFRYLQDTYNVRSINFHPSGDYILTGTDHNAVRIFDVKTFQCFTASADADNTHEDAITQVRYSNTGNVFVTSSTDGDIRVWDAISGRCVRHIAKGHDGASVSSIRISKTGKYLLSSGKDSIIRLWDVGSGKMISKYEGASQLTSSGQATFSWNENIVISSDDMDNSVLFWDARTSELLKRFKGPNTTIRFIATSPTDPGYVTCSDDFRARYWNVLDELDGKGR